MTGPMTVVSFVFRSTPRWAAFSRVRCQKNPRCWGASWPLTLAPRDGFAVGAQAAQRGDVAGVAVGRGGQHRVPRGDRDAAEGGAGREFRAAAGDGLRAGRDRGRGGFPLPARAALRACFSDSWRGLARSRLAALRALPLPAPSPGLAGRVAALFLQLRRGQDLARGGQPGCPPAQQVIGQVMIAQARDPPHRLLRRGDVDPRPLVQRASQRLEHPLRAARRPFPGRGERVAPGQPRGHRDRDHARQS